MIDSEAVIADVLKLTLSQASLAELHAGRKIDDYIRPDKSDDVADPVGQPRPVYEETALQLDGLLARVVAWLPVVAPPAQAAS